MKLDKILLIFGTTPMTNAQLKISVIIPVYNQALFIAEAIESILNQTHKVDEIVVVDDGSTDDLKNALKPYNKSIILVNHTMNKGVAAARNSGIEKAKHELILFQDADDIAMENRVEYCVHAFQDREVFYVRGLLQNFIEPDQKGFKLLADKESLIAMHSPGTGSLAVRKKIFNQIGLFDITLMLAEDIDWEMRARDKGFYPTIINELLIKRRLHANNISHLTVEAAAALRLKIFRKNLFSKK